MRFLTKIMIGMLFFPLATAGQTATSDSVKNVLKKLPSDSARAAFLTDLSVKYRNSDFSKSLAFAQEARAIAEKAGVRKELGKALMQIGVEYYYMGSYKESIQAYLDALRVFEESKDKKGEASVLNEIGTFDKRHGDTAQARIKYERAMMLSEEINDSSQMANSMNNLGLVYELRNEDQKAMEYFEKSAIIKERLHDFIGVVYNYDNMGGNLTKQRRYSEAEKWLQKAIDLRRTMDDKTGLALSVNNMGEMYLEKGEPAKARKYFTEALALTFVTQYVQLRGHVYSMISETWKAENNYQKAFEYYKNSIHVKDSIFSEQQRTEILNIQAKYETEKKEHEIIFLKEENEIKDYKIRQNTLYIVGLVLLVPVLLLLGYFWRNRITLKQKAELQTTRAQLRESQLEAVISSQEKERKRFAADLHDGLGQMISALRLSLSRENPEKTTVDQALGLLQEMNVEIRNIAFNLMPHVLVKGGLEEALTELAGRVNRLGAVKVSITTFDLSAFIPDDRKIALYRICQEWVNNAMKYSGCSSISIELIQHPDELVIMIEDDGNGFDKDILIHGEGNGWKNISSRLAMMKASIEINSRAGHAGTTAVIACPLASTI